jgi:Kef-type K+ transport system membrane component KefB
VVIDAVLVAALLAAAFAVGRLTRRHLPELVSWLVVGALLGPSGLALLPGDAFDHLRPLIQIATAVLMFLVGERLSLHALRLARWVSIAAVSSYVAAALAVYVCARLAGADQTLSLLLGTLSGGGAPMTVAALAGRRRGYADGLVAFHAGCDMIAAIVFAAVLPAVVLADVHGRTLGGAVRTSLQLGLAGAALGVAVALSLSTFVSRSARGGRAIGVLVVVHVAAAAVVCLALGLSIPLCALVLGAVTASRIPRQLQEATFVPLTRIEFPLYLLFFTLAGAAIRLEALPRLGLIGAAYIGGRTIAKLVSGTVVTRWYGFSFARAAGFGLASLPQAGVAVALAAVGSAALPGRGIATITLGSIVVFETVGAAIVRWSLDHVGDSPPGGARASTLEGDAEAAGVGFEPTGP